MNKEFVTSTLANNWYLFVVLIGIVVAAVVMSQGGGPNSEDPSAVAAASVDAAIDARMEESRWSSPTRDQQVLDSIDKYEEELKYNRRSSETPANLYRLANLYYSKLLDYDKASLYYEALLQEFPDYEGLQTVYPNLATCYQRSGKFELERQTYRRMLDYYPSTTQDYAWAKAQLGH